MLQSVKAMKRALVQGTDGKAGHINQLLIDDTTWMVRHLVVYYGWLKSNQVLMSPHAVSWFSPASQTLYVTRTRQQVASSPDLAADPPVSQQHLMHALSRSIPPLYSCEPGMSATYAYVALLASPTSEQQDQGWDPHLQSSDSFLGASIAARDATFGLIDDLLIDDSTWRIRHVVIKTRIWGGRRVAIEPSAVRSLSWTDSLAVVDMWRADIEQSPAATSLTHPKVSSAIVPAGWYLRW